jgi:hypothetical protein
LITAYIVTLLGRKDRVDPHAQNQFSIKIPVWLVGRCTMSTGCRDRGKRKRINLTAIWHPDGRRQKVTSDSGKALNYHTFRDPTSNA